MDRKDPISFQARKRERRQKQRSRGPGKPSGPVGGGELDEVRMYWQRFVRHPFQGPGRLLWTERMFWGNALVAGIFTGLGDLIEKHFQLMAMVYAFISAFFLFALMYYVFPWVTTWLLQRIGVKNSSVDGLKLELIVLSGWLTIVNLISLVPYYSPLPYYAAMVGFAVLVLLATKRQTRTNGMQTFWAGAGGMLAVLVVWAIFSTI